MKPKTVGGVILIAMAACACGASIPPPNDQWAAAQADVGRAEASGAPGVPDAKLHLQLAQEDLQKSKLQIGVDNQRAATLIEVARVEAQLAQSLAKQAVSQDEARKAQAELQKASAK